MRRVNSSLTNEDINFSSLSAGATSLRDQGVTSVQSSSTEAPSLPGKPAAPGVGGKLQLSTKVRGQCAHVNGLFPIAATSCDDEGHRLAPDDGEEDATSISLPLPTDAAAPSGGGAGANQSHQPPNATSLLSTVTPTPHLRQNQPYARSASTTSYFTQQTENELGALYRASTPLATVSSAGFAPSGNSPTVQVREQPRRIATPNRPVSMPSLLPGTPTHMCGAQQLYQTFGGQATAGTARFVGTPNGSPQMCASATSVTFHREASPIPLQRGPMVSSPLLTQIQTPMMSICIGSVGPATTVKRASTPPPVTCHDLELSSEFMYDGVIPHPQDLLDPSLEKCPVEMERRINQREKQIAIGKDTQGYVNYVAAIPRDDREVGNELHPVTPRANFKSSKRTFDRTLAAWRRALHKWDDVEAEGDDTGVTFNEDAPCNGDEQFPSNEVAVSLESAFAFEQGGSGSYRQTLAGGESADGGVFAKGKRPPLAAPRTPTPTRRADAAQATPLRNRAGEEGAAAITSRFEPSRNRQEYPPHYISQGLPTVLKLLQRFRLKQQQSHSQPPQLHHSASYVHSQGGVATDMSLVRTVAKVSHPHPTSLLLPGAGDSIGTPPAHTARRKGSHGGAQRNRGHHGAVEATSPFHLTPGPPEAGKHTTTPGSCAFFPFTGVIPAVYVGRGLRSPLGASGCTSQTLSPSQNNTSRLNPAALVVRVGGNVVNLSTPQELRGSNPPSVPTF